MRAEIISIGDEITTGQRLDTNSQWLAERLTELGCDVAYHTTVADELAANVDVFRAATRRADVVVATGGLGPTADDLTREAIAEALGVPLVLDEGSLAHIESLFASRGRTMPERNRLQAMFPQGTLPIANEHGTAPGIAAAISRNDGTTCRVFALPGVPAEMKPMFVESVAPQLTGDGPRQTVRHRRIKCFGLGESHVEAKLPDLIRRGREPRVGITVSDATITLRITATGADEAACQAVMQPTAEAIYAALGDLVFGEEEAELQDVVAELLAKHGLTLATGEIASAGLLAQPLASLASEVYRGGTVESSAPSEATCDQQALQLARRACELFGASIGLGVSAFGDDPSGKYASPAVAVAIVTGAREVVRWYSGAGHPAIQKVRTAKLALNQLRLALLRRELDLC